MIKKYLTFLILLILIAPTFYTLIRPGFFPMQDDLQAFRLYEMNECFKNFQIPCRWVPDAGFGFGYPLFNFYSPGVYYLGEIFHLLGIQFIDTVKILFILGFLLGAVFMYLLAKELFGKWPALVSALLFTITPFRATEVYVRGSLSEFFSQAFFPFIFWSSYMLIKTKNLKYLIWLSLGWGLLLITHNLMTFIFAPIFLIWIIYWMWIEKKWIILPKLFGGLLLGMGLASFFVVPLSLERGFVHLDTLLGGYFDYRQHFTSLYQLFISNHFGYGSSFLGPNDDLSLSAGIVHWIIGVIAIILSFLNLKKNRKIALSVLILAAVEFLVLFLMHQKSSFIWENLIALHWLQFPWRFLASSYFLLSIMGGAAIFFLYQLISKKYVNILILFIISLLIILHGSNFEPKSWLNISDEDKFSGGSWQKQLTISIFDYLPIFAYLPPNHEAPPQPEILEGEARILNYQKGDNYQMGEIEVLQDAKIRLPIFDFPGMQVLIDGKVVEHTNNDCRGEDYCFGLISFNIPKGGHVIKAELRDTFPRTFGNIATMVSFLILVSLIFKYGYKKNS